MILLIIVLSVIGCNNGHKSGLTGGRKDYTIRVKGFSTKDSAEIYRRELGKEAEGRVVCLSDTSKLQNKFYVELGEYATSYLAGRNAYELMKAGALNDYKIFSNGQETRDDYAEVFFAGKYRGIASVYKYNIRTKKTQFVWSKPQEMVVELVYSEDRRSVFFITASEYGRKTIFPYVNNVKLYRITTATMKIEKLKTLGNGVQLFTNRETPNSLQIIFNSFDKKKSTIVIQNKFVYNSNGRMLLNEKKIFDIVTDKYPASFAETTENMSPDNKYKLLVKNIRGLNIFYFAGQDSKNNVVIIKSKQMVNQVAWSDDGKYLIFSTNNISPNNRTLYSSYPQTSGLFVYSAIEKKLLSDWHGGGYKNFILQGDLLFFDDGFNDHSKIFIHEIKTNKITDTIELSGGNGIRNIPTTPY
ncbi:MAG: hypothetical protein WCJ01_07855 [Ignavibacteria bacterium]